MVRRDDYIRIAGECGAFVEVATPEFLDFLVRYGQATTAAVREECAKVCQWKAAEWKTDTATANLCAEAIRARGQS